jgi:hypothetical protein
MNLRHQRIHLRFHCCHDLPNLVLVRFVHRYCQTQLLLLLERSMPSFGFSEILLRSSVKALTTGHHSTGDPVV